MKGLVTRRITSTREGVSRSALEQTEENCSSTLEGRKDPVPGLRRSGRLS